MRSLLHTPILRVARISAGVDTVGVVATWQAQDVLETHFRCQQCAVRRTGGSLWRQVGREHARKVVGAASHVGLARDGLCPEGLTRQV
jgi:hypothetical protein